MKLNIFKRSKTKLENALDGDTVIEIAEGLKDEKGKTVTKEVAFETLVNSYTAVHNMHGYANGDHLVKVGEEEMSVNDLVKKHIEMCNKAKEEPEGEGVENDGEGEPSVDVEDKAENEAEEDKPEQDDKAENEAEEDKPEEDKKKNEKEEARKKAAALKNARPRQATEDETAKVDLSVDQVARGKQRYGSGS